MTFLRRAFVAPERLNFVFVGDVTRLPSCGNDTFTLRIMSLQRHAQCDRSERKNRARARSGRKEEASEGLRVCMCIGAYRKTEKRRKKNSRKRSGALAEQKGTKLISEALTNYFLRKGVGYLQLSARSPRHLPLPSPPHPLALSLWLRGGR